jgi:hypothetical protein
MVSPSDWLFRCYNLQVISLSQLILINCLIGFWEVNCFLLHMIHGEFYECIMVLQLLENNVQLLKSNDLHIAEQNYTNWETGISLFNSCSTMILNWCNSAFQKE